MKIQIKAIGVNRADVFHRQGKYPASGLEVAGVAADGRRVMGIVNDGGYAREIELSEGSWMEIPAALSFVEGASIIEALYTSYYNLVSLCALKKGEKVLIHGGASGIGVVAIQLAQLIGAEVETTAGKKEKLELIESLGARAINYTSLRVARSNPPRDLQTGLPRSARNDDDRFGNDKYDVILDMVGADYFNDNLAALRNGGRLAIIAFISGAKVDAKLGPILLKNLSVYGSMIRSLVKGEILRGFAPYVGKIKPMVDKVFGFEEIDAALDYVEAYKNLGKVVVEI